MQFTQKNRFVVAVSVFCLTFIFVDCLQAKPENLNKPLIEQVFVDYSAMEILIFGQNLRGQAEPRISLSSLPISLSANDKGAIDAVIAILPDWYEDGDHLLVLTTEAGTSIYNLKISSPNVQCNYIRMSGVKSEA